MPDIVPYNHVFPCRKLVIWESKPVIGKPSCVCIDLTVPNAPKIELSVTHLISSGDVIELKPEKLVYLPEPARLRNFLCLSAYALATREYPENVYCDLVAQPESVTVSEAYREITLRLNTWECFRVSFNVNSCVGTGKKFPFHPGRGATLYTSDGKPVGRCDMSIAIATHAIHSLLATLRV